MTQPRALLGLVAVPHSPFPQPELKITWPRGRLVGGTAGRPLELGGDEGATQGHSTRNKIMARRLRYRSSPRPVVAVSSLTTSAAESGPPPVSLGPGPDQLASARHVGGNSIWVQFCDGLEATVDVGRFGVDLARLHLSTARVGECGSAVEIRDVSGDTVAIDSSVFRSYADPKYAAELETVIADYYARGGSPPSRR